MAGPQGYSLEQLLTWSIEDCLIDGYERSGDLLVIVQGKLRREIPYKDARGFLKGMFRQHPRLRKLEQGRGLGPAQACGGVVPAGWALRTG